MCGIIAVLRRKSRRVPPDAAILDQAVAAAQQALAGEWSTAALDGAARALADLDRQLRGVPGTLALLGAPAVADRCRAAMVAMQQRIGEFERRLDADARAADAAMEQRNAALVRLKDAVWAVVQDRLPHAEAVRALAGAADGDEAIAAWSAIQLALAALDRLEVRGRDSAGLCVMVSGVDATAAEWRVELLRRAADPLFQHGSVRATAAGFDFVYKHAAEIGELGDNVRSLRDAIARDGLLHAVLQRPGAEALVLGHTRWASVGIISEPNAHPLNSEEVVEDAPAAVGPYVIGALNGDVDNHVDLVRQHGLCLPPEITTDAKVIPTLVSRRMAQTGGAASGSAANGGAHGFVDAFRQTVAEFEGSVAIAAATAADPHRLALALRGSGQALYVGLAEDTFVVASEPYGVIEECDRYLRMDGETPGNAQNPNGSRGQVVVLERQLAGEAGGIARQAYDGTPLPLAEKQLAAAAITTRDIDRAGFPHFVLKKNHKHTHSSQKKRS